MNTHETYMKHCLELASQGFGKVTPNPMVGCVILYEKKIIGKGFHQQYGQAHAEVNAIRSVENKELLKKSTLYVNLEPCSHVGKTPPCADLIIEHKIPYVVIGSVDSNSLVAGRGIEKLLKAGIDVKVGILEEECKQLNKRFFTFHQKKRPYIILKWAQSADGFIDVKRGGSMEKPIQISNLESKTIVHQWRSEEQAIMVGTNTALLDNPQLTVREVSGTNPLRITIDKFLRIPKEYHLCDGSTPSIIFTAVEASSSTNLEYIKIDVSQPIVAQILHELYKKNIHSLLVEGGAQLINSFIHSNFWDEARVFVSDKKIQNGVHAPVLKTNPAQKENISTDQLLIYFNTNQFIN